MIRTLSLAAFIATLLVAPVVQGQQQTDSARPYEFKATHLGMSLSEFKQAMAGDKVTITAPVLQSGPFANARWKKHSKSEVLDTPLCTDGERNASADSQKQDAEDLKNGEVSCDASPQTSNPQFRTVAGIPLGSVIYRFYKEKLYSITITSMSSSFEELTSAFTEKYGTPKNAPPTYYQNGNGARWTGRNFLWQRGKQEILFSEGAGNGPRTVGMATADIIGECRALIIDPSLAPPPEKKKPLDF